MDEVSLEVSGKEQELMLQQIKARCIECTVRLLGHNQPFQKLQFYFFRLSLLFLKYSQAMQLSENLVLNDFQISTQDITTSAVVDRIREESRLNGIYFDPLLALATAQELDFRHQLALVFSMGLTNFTSQREFNDFYGVESGFIQRYTAKALEATMENDSEWDANKDQRLIRNAKECLEKALKASEDLLIKYENNGLVSSEGEYYNMCRLMSERTYVDTVVFTDRQMEIWNYISNSFMMKGRFPTYLQICSALDIADELFWDNIRSIGDKIENKDQPYRKSRNGQYVPLDNDSLPGRIIQIYSNTPSKLKKAKLSDKEREIANLLVNPIAGSIYRSIAEVAAELDISKENVRRALDNILNKLETDVEDLYITKNGESLPETHNRVRLCKMIANPTFMNLFNDINRRFILLMTERVNGVFRYSNLEVESLVWGSVVDENEVDSSSRVNRKLASIFERLEEVEMVDTTGFKIRGNRLTVIKMRKSLNPELFRRLTTSDLDVLMAATEQKAPKIYLSMEEVAKRLNTNKDSARMRITFLLKKLNGLQES
jgi:DNA-binding CsgD family transcriptional regulator